MFPFTIQQTRMASLTHDGRTNAYNLLQQCLNGTGTYMVIPANAVFSCLDIRLRMKCLILIILLSIIDNSEPLRSIVTHLVLRVGSNKHKKSFAGKFRSRAAYDTADEHTPCV